MYKHPVLIPSLAPGIVLTMVFSVSSIAQDKKPTEKVQIKIIENGKVKTDTSFTIDYDVNPKDLDLMIKDLDNDKEGQMAEKLGPGKKHSKKMKVYRYHNGPEMEDMDSMMKNMEREFNYEYTFNSKNDSVMERNFRFRGDFDSIITYKDGKREKMMNPGGPDMLDMEAPGPCAGCDRHGKRYIVHTSVDVDNEEAPGEQERVIIKKHGGPGEKRTIIEEREDQNFETIEDTNDVVIKRKVSPDNQKIIIEKSNPDVTIKKGKKGRVEIIIEDKKSDNSDKK